jgi:hypothetical protein
MAMCLPKYDQVADVVYPDQPGHMTSRDLRLLRCLESDLPADIIGLVHAYCRPYENALTSMIAANDTEATVRSINRRGACTNKLTFRVTEAPWRTHPTWDALAVNGRFGGLCYLPISSIATAIEGGDYDVEIQVDLLPKYIRRLEARANRRLACQM